MPDNVTIIENIDNISVTLPDGSTNSITELNEEVIINTDSPNVDITQLKLIGDVNGGSGTFQLATVLASILMTPGTFTNPTINVNNKGLITSISSGSSTAVHVNGFTVANDGDNHWSISATATTLLAVFINGVDYAAQSSISPPGSGIVEYIPGSGGYTTQSGDIVRVLWS